MNIKNNSNIQNPHFRKMSASTDKRCSRCKVTKSSDCFGNKKNGEEYKGEWTVFQTSTFLEENEDGPAVKKLFHAFAVTQVSGRLRPVCLLIDMVCAGGLRASDSGC